MSNTSTVHLKTFWLFLFMAISPFILVAETTENKQTPSFNCPIEDLIINCSDDINTKIDAWLSTSSTSIQQSLPDGYSLENNYAGIPPQAVCQVADGGFQVIFTASNQAGASQICSANIIIFDDEVVIEQCPISDLVLNSTDNVEQNITVWLSASNALLSTAATNPEGCDGVGEITVTNNYNGNPPTGVCNVTDGGLLVTFTATDECGNLVTCSATIFIIDDEVVIEECPTLDLFINASNNIESVINDWLNRTTDLVQIAATNPDGNDGGIGEIIVTNDYDGTLLNSGCDGVTNGVVITFTAADECGNTAQCQGEIIIYGTGPPILDCFRLADVTVDCNDDLSSSNIGVPLILMEDNNNLASPVEVTLTSEDDNSNLGNCTGTIIRTWTATNACGLTATCVQAITIVPAIEEATPCQELDIQSIDNQLIISNIQAANPIVKIFDANWQIVSNCSGDCLETVTIPNLPTGEVYHTDIQLYDEHWQFICEDKQDIEIIGGGEPCDTSICLGDVILQTQAEVDAFCGCEVIEGNLILGDNTTGAPGPISDINDISILKDLKRVEGSLLIFQTMIESLESLSKLTSVVNTMSIVWNPKLKFLTGLEKLKTVNGQLVIESNELLENLDGLIGLERVSKISIIGKSINSLLGLQNLKTNVITDLSLINCDELESLEGLESIDSIFGEGNFNGLTIAANDKLKNLSALSGIRYLEDILTIANNPILADCCGISHLIDSQVQNGSISSNKIFINDNLQFCNSPEIILQACQSPPPLCENIEIITHNNQIIIDGLTAPNEIVKVFDKDFNIVYQCVANCEDRQMAGTFPLGTYVIDLQLYDENWGFICAEQRTVNLENTNPCNTIACETIPPVLTDVPTDMTVSCDDSYNDFTNVIATDNCDHDVTIEYEEIETPGIGSNCRDNYIVTRIWTAIDDCGNSSEAKQVIHIQDNTAPILANIPADETVECDAIPSISENVTATDNCDSDVTIEYNEQRTNGNCLDSYVLTRTWTARDNCDNSIQGTQVIVVLDVTPPVLTNLPPDLTFNAEDGFDTTFPLAVDNCDEDVELTVDDLVNPAETEIIRTFTATDNCGNSATAQQIITIIQDGNNPCENIAISMNNKEIQISMIDAPNRIVKIFDNQYQIIFECIASCENELIVPVEAEGIYHTDVQFYDANWSFICEDKQTIEVTDGGVPCDTTICLGDVVLRTQADVDAFCGCEVIKGRLDIGTEFYNAQDEDAISSNITSLANLEGLKKVEGGLSIKHTNIRTLKGLDSLIQVDSSFSTSGNEKLLNLSGLESLESVGKIFSITYNPLIENVVELKNLSNIGTQIRFHNNNSLTSIKGLSSLQTTTTDWLIIRANPRLINLDGLESLELIKDLRNGNLEIYNNSSLTDISAIKNIKFVENNVRISRNPQLADCCILLHLLDGDQNNGDIKGDIVIENNAPLCRSPFEIIRNCPIISPFSCEITEISSFNSELIISKLTAPLAIVKVFNNNYATVYECFGDCEETINLTDLPAGTYHVNINAYDENWSPICERNESVEVGGNAQDRGIDFSPADFALYPNPAKTAAFVDLSKLKGERVELYLYNQFGQQVNKQVIEKVEAQRAVLDLSTTQNGVYILKIKTKNRKAVAKKLMVSRLY